MKGLKRLGTILAIAPLLSALVPGVASAQQPGALPIALIAPANEVSAPPVQPPAIPATYSNSSNVTSSTQDRGANAAASAGAASAATGPAATAVALRMKHLENEAPAPLPRGGRADSKALMIVGLAAVVAGLVVGDDAGTILVLGGAGIGLYGLYKYMQ
jgi:hypothetical protein